MKTRACLLNHSGGHDAPLLPTFGSHATAPAEGDEIAKLRLENSRLQQIVAELLIANQHLRRRITDAGAATEHGSGAAPQQTHRHD
jgi:hypothetical protein